MSKSSNIRQSKGQVILTSVTALILFVIGAVVLTMLGLNLFFCLNYSERAQTVADETARAMSELTWYLGMERPATGGLNRKARATQIANYLADALGLPAPVVEIRQSSDLKFSYATVSFSGLKLPYSNTSIPLATTITRQGVSSSNVEGPTALANLEVRLPDLQTIPPSPPRYRGVQVPALFFFTNSGAQIARDKFGGGGPMNNELGSYFAGITIQDDGGGFKDIRKLSGDGSQRSQVPISDGFTHGELPTNSQFSPPH